MENRTIEWKDDLRENMQDIAKLMLEQLKESADDLSEVRNRHEGYGIAAEGYASLMSKLKDTKTEMSDFLRLLPSTESNIINVISALYNSVLEVGVESIRLAAQCQRVLNDLYYKEQQKTPIEEYIEEREKELGEFEEVEEIMEV